MSSFRVSKLRKTAVAAAVPMREHWLPLSNLDLLVPPIETSVFFCYQKPSNHSFPSVVSILKKALSKTLVPYYAFSGEMDTNSVGEPELFCSNRGVDFEEAYADVGLRDLNLFKLNESIEAHFLPVRGNGVLAAQVTQLKCGGVVMGCTFDHRVADGYSANMFWKSWAETALSKPLSHFPSFRRSLLSPRRPGRFDTSTDVFIQQSKIPLPQNLLPRSPYVSRLYSVSAKEICNLQVLASNVNPNTTKVEALSAYLWKILGTRGDHCRLGVMVDGRERIVDGGEMRNYCGNLVSLPFGRKSRKELEEMTLSSIASDIHKFLDTAVRKEHFQGLVDLVEENRPDLMLSRMAVPEGEDLAIVVSSVKGFPNKEMDFGWGAPLFGSYHFPPGLPICFVVLFPSPFRDGDWIVNMQLPVDQIDVIQNTAGHFFKPLSLG